MIASSSVAILLNEKNGFSPILSIGMFIYLIVSLSNVSIAVLASAGFFDGNLITKLNLFSSVFNSGIKLFILSIVFVWPSPFTKLSMHTWMDYGDFSSPYDTIKSILSGFSLPLWFYLKISLLPNLSLPFQIVLPEIYAFSWPSLSNKRAFSFFLFFLLSTSTKTRKRRFCRLHRYPNFRWLPWLSLRSWVHLTFRRRRIAIEVRWCRFCRRRSCQRFPSGRFFIVSLT